VVVELVREVGQPGATLVFGASRHLADRVVSSQMVGGLRGHLEVCEVGVRAGVARLRSSPCGLGGRGVVIVFGKPLAEHGDEALGLLDVWQVSAVGDQRQPAAG
jgi:hypothetical protein